MSQTLNVALEPCTMPATVIDTRTAINAVMAVYSCPNGVERMSDAMPGLG